MPYRLPAIVTGVYALMGLAWILLSDRALYALELSPAAEASAQTLKGWFYVLLSALLIFGLLVFSCRLIIRHQAGDIRSRERLDLALRAGRGAVIEIDIQGQSLYLSEHGKELLGITEEGLLDQETWWSLIHPDDLTQVNEAIMRLVMGPNQTESVQFRAFHAEGHSLWFSATAQLRYDSTGQPKGIIGALFDVTDTLKAQNQIESLINYDQLTGLPKARLFMRQMSDLVGDAGNQGISLCARIDIHGFAELRNTHGAEVSDSILRKLANRLYHAPRYQSILSRLGDERFAILVHGIPNERQAQKAARQISQRLSEGIRVEGEIHSLMFRVGVALCPLDSLNADELFSHAELALLSSGDKAGPQIAFYAPGMDAAFKSRAGLLRALRVAVAEGGLDIEFQPIARTRSRALVGFEVLSRWRHPEFGFVSPATFIPLAEEAGLIGKIGDNVLRRACEQAVKWAGDRSGPVMLSVNVSAVQLEDGGFVDYVRTVLKETGCPPSLIELEITESSFMSDIDHARRQLHALSELGIGIAIDDFGTGYSSLAVLRDLAVTKLKIDASFIQDIKSVRHDLAMVRTILELGRSLELDVTAEGVETDEQLAMLAELGCPLVQGFLLGHPMSLSKAEEFMTAHEVKSAPVGLRTEAYPKY
jgi:PAS domain S-box-containing protein/diguanylate cyclase (GGDEF)-like protein